RMDEAPNNKQLLVDMMQKFNAVYPDKGLMIALDELLDFLRARDEKALILDLNFLREVGEACELLPLRFIAGIQEALFDNSRFQFAADSIRRVKARFDQAMIVREDIAYVVSHRLLTKTDNQKKTIRKHLEVFTSLYSEMAERLDLFIDLFPVHPAYIEMFEQVTIGERRDLLKALSSQMSELLDKPVPTDQPGLITFDAYWRLINEDSAFRTIPEVRNVQDKAKVLEERIRQAPEMKQYRDAALRIIDGLALHRLTVSDIYSPIGITPKEIRDRLCIHLDLPEEDADFLLATIETVMKAISMAVSGQFISHNSENDQYYLDLKKDIDFEALIEAKAKTLAESTLDRYYFEVLVQALELTDSNYVPGFRIWERELPWPGHGITRRGYVFLGGSNDRSTAHPARDFYLHFHALMGNGKEVSTYLADEVFFYLPNPEPLFVTTLKSYAGAKEMSAISAGSNKDQYDRKSGQLLSKLTQWMRENFIRAFKVHYQADELTLTEAIARTRVSLRDLPFRDQVFRIGASLLDAHFCQKYPDYPRFEGVDFTSATTWSAADGALRALAGGPVNRPAQTVLEGLQLGKFSNGKMSWSIENSPYATYYQALVSGMQQGRVINRGELINGEPGAERDVNFGLEPEFLLVVLSALVRQGGISINLAGVQIAESDLSGASRVGLDQLIRFTSISRPKPLPEHAVRELFSQMQIDPDSLSYPRALASALNQLQQKVQEELNDVVRMLESLHEGPKFWQKMILPPEEQQKYRKELEEYRQFLTGVQSFSTPARLANLTQSVSELKAIFQTRKIIQELESLFDALQSLRPAWDYL
ncbi:MAG: ATP-binding protein, partial [Planctomycetes bacterium]|nr:ATP-binding protein [Planctomycetota bacterium]